MHGPLRVPHGWDDTVKCSFDELAGFAVELVIAMVQAVWLERRPGREVVDTEHFEEGAALLRPIGREILGPHLQISLGRQIGDGLPGEPSVIPRKSAAGGSPENPLPVARRRGA